MEYEQEKKVKHLLTATISDWSDQNELSTSPSMECELTDMIFDIVIQGGTLAEALKSGVDNKKAPTQEE